MLSEVETTIKLFMWSYQLAGRGLGFVDLQRAAGVMCTQEDQQFFSYSCSFAQSNGGANV